MRSFTKSRTFRALMLGLIATSLSGAAALAKPVDEAFYRAYYLEREKGQLEEAARLYEEVAGASGTDAAVKAEARARLAAVREEIATSDFAQLMPPDALLYAEFSRPGDQVARLLGMLGLLRDPAAPGAADEVSKALSGRHVAISPALIKGLLGIRGAAVAVTGFDPAAQMPSGVAIFHPGDQDLVRGLIESGLPAGAEAVKPIEGFPTYQIKEANNLVICLTSRLVIVSPQRPQIVAVIKRMNGEGESLAGNKELAEVLAMRKDALIYYCVNARSVVPMVKSFAGVSKDLATAQAVLDLDSLNWVAGRIGVGEHGIYAETGIGLEPGHHNLAYNLIRTPPVTQDTLKCVPKGAAGLFAAALGTSGGPVGWQGKGETKPAITGLDLGREIFANIVDFAIFGLPPSGDGRSDGGAAPPPNPMAPDIAAVIRVNDPAKSEALWTQILGLASLATGAPTTDGKVEEISGASVRTYQFPESVLIYFTTLDDKIMVSGSRYAIARAVEAAKGGDSILNDEAFAASIARLEKGVSKAILVHPGRCFQMARPFMGNGDVREAEPYIGMLTHTVASILTHESESEFRISASVTGLPNVAGLVAQAIQREHHRGELESAAHAAAKREQWEQAAAHLDKLIAEDEDNAGGIRQKFDLLATGKKDRDAALACAEALMAKYGDNAAALNEFAWALLTEKKYAGEYNDLALKAAEKACALTQHKDWMILDTLALARFETGEIDTAIELQRKAVELEGGNRKDVKEALERYESAKTKGPTARSD